MTESPFSRAAQAVYGEFTSQVDSAAAEARVPQPAAYDAVRHELRQLLAQPGFAGDARTTLWRARVRLYSAAAPTEAVADTDPDVPADGPGASVLHGLTGVAAYLSELASRYHAPHTVEGLDGATLKHRLKSLRPTLSRRGGDAVWRVPYETIVLEAPSGMLAHSARQSWIARVDVEKVV